MIPAALCMLVLCASPVISGNKTAGPGELVTLSATGTAESYTWVFVQPAGHPFIQSDRMMGFATKCGNGTYIVVLLSVSLEAGKPIINSTTHTVVVGGSPAPPNPEPLPPDPQPQPEPEPQPTPTPVDPVFPAGRFGLAKLSYDATKALSTNARAKSPLIGANFAAVAAAAAAGAYSGSDREKIDKANAEISTKNRTALGGDTASWTPCMSIIGKRMSELWNSKEMTTLEDHVAAYREIAEGLKAAK